MSEHAAIERPYNPLWDEGASRRGKRRGARLAIALSLAAHAALVYVIYETKFVPHLLQVEDDGIQVAILSPKKPPPPPPPPPEQTPPKVEPPKLREPLNIHETAIPPDLGPVAVLPIPPVEQPLPPRPQADDPPKPPPPLVISNPNWSAKPSGEDMARYYPERAQRLEVGGKAVIQCQVTAKGAVAGCSVLSEDPETYGFGEAAVKLSRLFKMKPRLENGQAVEGATVRIPIVFHIAG